MNRQHLIFWLAVAGVLMLTLPVFAQLTDYHLVRYTINSGSSISSSLNSDYTMRGTVGQPDVLRLENGRYTLRGGFWGLDQASPTLDPPDDERIFLPFVMR
jgi:hypothetical protein